MNYFFMQKQKNSNKTIYLDKGRIKGSAQSVSLKFLMDIPGRK